MNEDPPPAPRVLLIDDDVELCELVSELLRDHGYDVEAVHDGARGLECAREGRHDIAILDVMLPEKSGLEVLRALREESAMPVLMLTARGSDEDRIEGLEHGADDYLGKPFNPLELAARVRAVLRRASGAIARAPHPITVGDLEVRPSAREVWVRQVRVHCTDAEFDILAQLLRTPGQAVPREALVERVLGRAFDPRDRSLDVHVSNLRKRLAAAGLDPAPIVTVRGEGYMLATPSPERAS